MIEKVIDGIKVTMSEEAPEEELRAYVDRAVQKYGHKVQEIKLRFDGEEVEIEYIIPPVRFNRLRRITGYLVGDMSRWNNGKRAEEHDRVKHGVFPEDPHSKCPCD